MYIGGHPSAGVNTPGLTTTGTFTGCISPLKFSLDYGAIRHVTSLDGKYEAVPHPMSWQQGRAYCQQNDFELASVHSMQEQQMAVDQCSHITQRQRTQAGLWHGQHCQKAGSLPPIQTTPLKVQHIDTVAVVNAGLERVPAPPLERRRQHGFEQLDQQLRRVRLCRLLLEQRWRHRRPVA